MLFVPKIYAAERVLVNGHKVGETGTFGLTPQVSRYLGHGQEVVIDTDGSDLDLEIDLSTFHHRENGFPEPPILGLAAPMNHWILLDWIRSLLLAASLLLLGCLSAVIFVFRPEEKGALYLTARCSRLRLAAYEPDLLIQLPRNVSTAYEFYRARELIERGREQAREALAHWSKSATPLRPT